MTIERRCASEIYDLTNPWVVLATSVFITACYTQNFTPLTLMRFPIVIDGKIENKRAFASLPKNFPLDEAFFEAQSGEIYSKVKDLPLLKSTKVIDDVNMIFFDLSSLKLPDDCQAFRLIYSPWFRFLVEPVSFDVVGKVSEYVASSFRFMLTRAGISAGLKIVDTETWIVETTTDFRIEIRGANDLKCISLIEGQLESYFDLEAREIMIDRRMFPDVVNAGIGILKTNDRLINLDLYVQENSLIMLDSVRRFNV